MNSPDQKQADHSSGGRGNPAIIMAAGVGSRLDPLTRTVCKPMVPVVGRPVMEYNVRLLAQHGFTRMIANLHKFPEQIRGHFGDGRAWGASLDYSPEEELLGTAGGVKRMGEVLWKLDETFVVMSADALTDIDLGKCLAFHRERKALATIALKELPDVTEFGVVILEPDGRIKAFQEKPKRGEELSRLVNTGMYIFEPEILQMIPEGFYDFGKQLFPLLVEKGVAFYGYTMPEYWCDVGSLEQYRLANGDVLYGKVQVELPGKRQMWDRSFLSPGSASGSKATPDAKGETWSLPDTSVDPSVQIRGKAFLGQGARVEADARIAGFCVLGNHAAIGRGAVVQDSIIWDGVTVPPGELLRGAILTPHDHIMAQ